MNHSFVFKLMWCEWKGNPNHFTNLKKHQEGILFVPMHLVHFIYSIHKSEGYRCRILNNMKTGAVSKYHKCFYRSDLVADVIHVTRTTIVELFLCLGEAETLTRWNDSPEKSSRMILKHILEVRVKSDTWFSILGT